MEIIYVLGELLFWALAAFGVWGVYLQVKTFI